MNTDKDSWRIRAEKAESDNAALEEDLEATEKNLKESSGFIEELLSGLKHRFPVQYADLEGDEYGDDAFSSHDLFELVIDPAVNAAQKAEAEVARLQQRVNELLSEELTDGAVRERIQLRGNMHEVLKQNELLLERLEAAVDKIAEIQEEWESEGVCHACGICAGIPYEWQRPDVFCCRVAVGLWIEGKPLPWESARQAVAAGEEACQKYSCPALRVAKIAQTQHTVTTGNTA